MDATIYAKPGDNAQQFGGTCPDGWVQMQGERPDGNYIASETGEWILKTASREEIEQLRLRAYADPVTGSDRFFNEAVRMQAMGETGWEQAKQQGVIRYKEIQELYPWPDEVQPQTVDLDLSPTVTTES